jgi:hypothetical protein
MTGSGGGGGAGGFGAIVNTGAITYTNSGSILGGAGGAGGASVNHGPPELSNGGNGGDGGIGVYLGGNLTTLINTGIITGGDGGAGGASLYGSSAAGAPAPGVYVASGISVAITNTGTITGGGTYSVAIQNDGTISTLTNNGGQIFGNNAGIYNQGSGTITLITNNADGLITGAANGIANEGTISTIINRGTILSSGNNGIENYSTIGLINNESSGLIWGMGNAGIGQWSGINIDAITNSGTIRGVNFGIYNQTTIGSITNNGGQILGESDVGILNFGAIGTITSITNSGTIGGLNYGIYNGGTITSITNSGMVTGGNEGIYNGGTITTFNNLQGRANNTPLSYYGNLPTNYNIIINSPTSYGQLAVTASKGTGQTSFGIYAGSKISNRTYASVITGLDPSNLINKSGTFGSATWLLSNSSGSIWDLIIAGYVEPVIVPVGPSIANTNQSIVNTASALQGTYTLQNSVIANSFSYDCTVFGANDVCVSAGGRNTQVQAANGLNNTSALLIAAYRPHPNYRIGAYADQNLSVSNPGGTVNLGNNTPLIGLFAAWNERLDGTGTEFKVSAAYGQKNTTMTRSVVGSGTGASEAGSGSSTLNSQGAQATAKYGFGILDNVIVSPYVGVRYTQNNMAGYTESTSSSVTAPLTYSALNTNATTALAGVGASYRVIPQVMTFASAGVETDTNAANGTYSATNSSIGTLTPVNFNANPVRTRPTATVGAYYDIEKNQRLGITGIYRQEAYQAVSTTTVLATYTVGL